MKEVDSNKIFTGDGLYIQDIKASKKIKNIHVVYNEGADLINIFFMDKEYIMHS